MRDMITTNCTCRTLCTPLLRITPDTHSLHSGYANLAFGEGSEPVPMSKEKKKRPSDDGRGTRVFAKGEDLCTLRLTSELVDLRVTNANPRCGPCTTTVWESTVLLSKERKTDHQKMVCFSLAAELGFEPRHTESESAVLPLHNSAKLLRLTIVSYIFCFVKCFF